MRPIILLISTFACLITFSQTILLTEDFENGFPSGWTQSGASTWIIKQGADDGLPNYAYSGSQNITLEAQDDNDKTKLVTSVIDFTGHTHGRLEFYFANVDYNSVYDDLRVYYSVNSSTGPWTEIFMAPQSDVYKEQIMDLPNVNSTYYIAFEGQDYNAYSVTIDDIKIYGTDEQAGFTGTYCDAYTTNGPVGDNQITAFGCNEIYLQAPNTDGYNNNFEYLYQNRFVSSHYMKAANLIAGQRHHFQYVDGYSGNEYVEQIQVWIDYNGDGDFDDANELVDSQSFSGSYGNAKAVYFYVPSNAKVGKTRLRIRNINLNNTIDPCIEYDYGQTFDFDIFIHPSMGPYVPIPDNNTITEIGENIYIAAVKLGNIQNITEYFGTTGSGTGSGVGYNYSNFMGQYSTILEEGKTYSIDLDVSYPSGWDFSTAVWIDWNNDGDFDDTDELIGKMTTSNSIYSFTVPSGLPAYNKYVALRARVIEDNSNGDYIASATATSAAPSNENETEDYKIYLAEKDYLLPVEWLSFEAKKVSSVAQLEWITASETNNNYFIIEHSIDAKKFEEIDRVDAAGNSNSTIEYKLQQAKLVRGNNYYRIKQVDYDGHFSYSEIRSLYSNAKVEIKIFPNPACNFIQVEGIVGNFSIIIKDINSKVILESHKHKIDVSFLPKGIYILELRTDQFSQNYKWIIH